MLRFNQNKYINVSYKEQNSSFKEIFIIFAFMEHIYENIKKYREQKGYSQAYMARKLGYRSASTYNKLENGEIEITINKIEQIARILEINIPQILNSDNNQYFNFHNTGDVNGAGAKEFIYNGIDKNILLQLIKINENILSKLKDKK